MNWTLLDFAVAGALLASVGGAFLIALRASRSLPYRAASAIALQAGLGIIWVALAVGIIDEEGAPADLMYAGVLSIGLAGAGLSRLRPEGMSYTLLAMAGASALIAAIAFVLTTRDGFDREAVVVLVFNAMLVGAFATSAFLFRLVRVGPAA